MTSDDVPMNLLRPIIPTSRLPSTLQKHERRYELSYERTPRNPITSSYYETPCCRRGRNRGPRAAGDGLQAARDVQAFGPELRHMYIYMYLHYMDAAAPGSLITIVAMFVRGAVLAGLGAAAAVLHSGHPLVRRATRTALLGA